jgi:teichoic acid transport system permease protein
MATPDLSRKALRRAGLRDVGERQYLDAYLRDIWNRREFAVAVPVGQLRSQHVNTFLGNVWLVLNPLLQMIVYYVLFGVILHTDRGIAHYLAFLAIGVFVFQNTQRCVQAGALSIRANEGLIRAIYFPRAILPISTVIGQTITFGASGVTMIAITLATGVLPKPTWVLIFPIVAWQMLFNVGAAFWTARIADKYPDFTNFLPHAFRIVLYLSGIMYSVDRFIHSPLTRRLFEANPMYSFVSLARGAILGLPVTKGMFISVFVWTVTLLISGFFFFRAGEHGYGRG